MEGCTKTELLHKVLRAFLDDKCPHGRYPRARIHAEDIGLIGTKQSDIQTLQSSLDKAQETIKELRGRLTE